MSAEGSSRLSIPYFPGQEQHQDDPRFQGRSFMFVRDVPLGIMPYRGNGTSDFGVSLQPADAAAAQWLTEILATRGHRPWSLEDAVSDFAREAAGALAYSGEIHFEVVAGAGDPDQERQLPNVQLMQFPPGRVLKIHSWYLQLVPRYAQDELQKRFVAIPATRVWRVRLPRELGSPRRHRRLLHRLARASNVVPSFAQGPTLGSDVLGYELGAYRLASDAEVENSTKRWGSIPSLQRIDGTTEFYLFFRTLQFRRSVALIREQIIRDINLLLERLGVPHVLQVDGLPSSDYISGLMQKLQEGTIDFTRASEESRTP